MRLNKEELCKIKGGSLTASFINVAVKGIQLLIDLGKGLGSTIRRAHDNRPCNI